MKNVIVFVVSYIMILIIYELFVVRKAKKYRDDDSVKKPVEVRYLVKKYGVNINKIDYNQMLQVIALVSSLDIAIIAAVMSLFKVLVVQILAGFIVMIPLMLISYSFIGNKYRKKMKK